MRLRALALALFASLVFAASAQASSIVFVRGGNVWLSHPDGSGQFQVTLDGTSDNRYYSPSQANDGTIVAARGSKLYRMTQNGTLLNTPFETESPLGNIDHARVSPDGKVVAYAYTTVTYTGRYNNPGAVGYTYSDHFEVPAGYGTQKSVLDPSWAGNSRTLLSTNSQNEWYDDVGGGDDSYSGGSGSNGTWWSDCDVFPDDCSNSGAFHYPHQMQMSPVGDRLALVRYTGDTPDASAVLDFLSANGGPPAIPTAKCESTGPDAGNTTQTFSNPTWSPDGQSLAWAEGDGIHVAHVGSLDDCSTITGFENPVIADALSPGWGPADVNPAPRQGTGSTNPGGSGSTGGTTNSGGATGQTSGGGSTGTTARCIVPKLKGKTLAKAKKALSKAHCKLGKVHRPLRVPHGAKLVVRSQSPRAGTRHKAGTKVAVTLVAHS